MFSDLAVGWVTEQLPLGVLHGTGDGAVHQPGHSQLRDAQLALQNRVLDQRETGRPGIGSKSNEKIQLRILIPPVCFLFCLLDIHRLVRLHNSTASHKSTKGYF